MDEPTSHRSAGYDGIVDTLQAGRRVCLMKCPALLSRSLQPPSSSDGSSRHVAKVIISIDPLLPKEDKNPPQYSMELIGTESGFAPKHYAMDLTAEAKTDCDEDAESDSDKDTKPDPDKLLKELVPMYAFSESTQGKISVEGKICKKFDMRPLHENMESYGKLCRERTKKYTTKSRQIQVIDNDTGSHMRPMPGMMIPLGFTEKKKAPAKGSEVKRTRRDRGEMEDIMFKLFERQSNWTLRQLIQETDQPEQFLKDLLKELCVYNNKGTNQGSYELKPEYKKHGDETTHK